MIIAPTLVAAGISPSAFDAALATELQYRSALINAHYALQSALRNVLTCVPSNHFHEQVLSNSAGSIAKSMYQIRRSLSRDFPSAS